MIAFAVDQWRAWAPGLDSHDAWQAWSQSPRVLTDSGEQPECLFVPAMQRRRLSRMARMTMGVAWPLCAEDEQLPFVFASRHGETPRTYALLGELADGHALSPTAFGLSVHNSIAGQWSILRGQRGESVAIAGETDTFEHALLEAATLMLDGATSVLLVIAEELPPSAYADWIKDVPFSYALAMRLSTCASAQGDSAATHWQLRLDRHDGSGTQCAWPHALDFLRVLQSQVSSMEHVWKTRRWNWQRTR